MNHAFRKHLYHWVHQTIYGNKMFTNDVQFPYTIFVSSEIICLIRTVEIEPGSHFLCESYALLPCFCVQLQLVAKLVRHSAKFWNLLDELLTRAEKYAVCQIYPHPPNQRRSLFLALWSFRIWPTLCRGEGGLEYSKIHQKWSSVSSDLQLFVRKCHLPKYIHLQSVVRLMTHLAVFGEFSSQTKVKYPPLPPAQC